MEYAVIERNCYGLDVHHPLNLYLEALILNMIFEGGALGRLLGHESGALTNSMSVLIKEPQESSLTLPRGVIGRR